MQCSECVSEVRALVAQVQQFRVGVFGLDLLLRHCISPGVLFGVGPPQKEGGGHARDDGEETGTVAGPVALRLPCDEDVGSDDTGEVPAAEQQGHGDGTLTRWGGVVCCGVRDVSGGTRRVEDACGLGVLRATRRDGQCDAWWNVGEGSYLSMRQSTAVGRRFPLRR